MTVVVSDTSPVRALAHLQHLDLLRDLFGTVSLPPAVVDELRRPTSGGPIVDVSAHSFFRVQQPLDRGDVERFLESLDIGESEALALAMELRASIVLIDEAAGRAVAEELGFLAIGTCGILLRARQRGLVGEIKPLLDDLIGSLGFFISPLLRRQVLKAAGESD
jgi:predicted nucleic acid-binding protein